jgi:hypothetical protein
MGAMRGNSFIDNDQCIIDGRGGEEMKKDDSCDCGSGCCCGDDCCC